MAISKGLYAAPQGLSDMDTSGIEIEIENPDRVEVDLGDVEIELTPGKPSKEDFDANLADFMDDSDLESLGSDLVSEFERDVEDRKEWIKTYV
jgi:hypothetical protein